MINVSTTITIDDIKASHVLRHVRTGLSNRRGLHARIVGTAVPATQEYVSKLDRHKTASSLGASPTNHLERAAKRISGRSSQDAATIRIPRNTRLRAAFGDYVILPGSGKKYLTRPAHAKTYGRRAGEISEPLHFQMVAGRFKALCFKDGTVAYWLMPKAQQKKDRTLLPSDAFYQKLMERVALRFVGEIKQSLGGAS